jgi:hypothetical protein
MNLCGAQSRGRCGGVSPVPGTDVAGASPSLGADVAAMPEETFSAHCGRASPPEEAAARELRDAVSCGIPCRVGQGRQHQNSTELLTDFNTLCVRVG